MYHKLLYKTLIFIRIIDLDNDHANNEPINLLPKCLAALAGFQS